MPGRAIVLAALCAGCGSGGPRPFDPIDAALCAWTVKCFAGGPSDEAACRASLAAQRGRAPYDANVAVAAGRLEIDTPVRDACAGLIRAADCTQLPLSRCSRYVRGRVPTDGTCLHPDECEAGYCERASFLGERSGCPGMCRPYAATGGACDLPRCGPADYCDPNTLRCRSRKELTEPCASTGECRASLVCERTVVATPPAICRAPGSIGQPCTSSPFAHTCELGLYCDTSGATPVCGRRAAEGEPCAVSPGCADGFQCVGRANGGAVCSRPLAAGQPCEPEPKAGVPGCALDTVCDAAKICRNAGDATGHPCISTADCSTNGFSADLYCDAYSKSCGKRVGLGQSCTPPPEGGAEPCDGAQCNRTTFSCTLVCS